MGICSSCLGLDRNRDLSDEFRGPKSKYHSGRSTGSSKGDGGLAKVVAQTSNHLVDIFAMVPQNVPRAPITMFTGQDARLLRYQDVLAKMPSQDGSSNTKQTPVEGTRPISDGWISDDEDGEEIKKYKPVKSEDVGPLLGGFADAESVME